MKLKTHVTTEVLLLPFLYFYVGLSSAIIIVLFHFIPSLDYLMKKINFYPNLHRQIFHNIFIFIFSVLIVYYLTDLKITILCALNFILHIAMDLGGKGVAIFYPLSKYRIKIKNN